MKIKNIAGTNVISASLGFHLENAKGDHIGTELWLGKEDSPSNYKEVEDTPEVTNG